MMNEEMAIWCFCQIPASNGITLSTDKPVSNSTGQPNIASIVHPRHQALFKHTACMSDDVDVKTILISDPSGEWSHSTWSSNPNVAFHSFNEPGPLETFTS